MFENETNRENTTQKDRPEYTEAGNADRFILENKGHLLYNKALGWLAWNGQKWAEGDGLDAFVKNEVNDFTRKMLIDATRQAYEAAAITGEVPESVNRAIKNATSCRKDAPMNSILSLTKAALYKRAKEFDTDPDILNTPGGIVNLRTGDITPHDKEAYCTKITKYAPSDEGRQEWGQFVNMVCCDDPDMASYLQQVIGCSLFGSVLTEGLYIASGSGWNGKSTFFNAIRTVLGDYAGTIDSAILTTSAQGKDAKAATLRGKRLIVCGELQEGATLSESTVKQITSTDNIQINKKFKDPEEITPSHSICLHTNNLPKITATDQGTWRRIHLMPFNATMPKGSKNKVNYADQLAARCGGAILQWAIEGALYCAANGFQIEEPAAVQDQLKRYRAGQNQVENFLTELCIVDPNSEVGAGELYTMYKAYCMQTGERAKRAEAFNTDMERLGFHKRAASGHTNKWQGLMINPSKGRAEIFPA